MKVILNGKDSGGIDYIPGSDAVLNAQILNDAGVPQDITGDTIVLSVYSNPQRTTALATKTAAIAGATEGHATFTIADDDANWEDLVPGASYFAAISWNDGSKDEVDPRFMIVAK